MNRQNRNPVPRIAIAEYIMKQPPQSSSSPPWFLIVGLLAGIAFVVYIVWDSAKPPPGYAPSAHVIELSMANWQKEVIESDVPVLVDFTAVWCGPCKKFAPIVNRLADRYQGKVKIAKFDVGDDSFDKAAPIQAKYGFRGVPHVMIFKGRSDQPVEQFSGGESERRLSGILDNLLVKR